MFQRHAVKILMVCYVVFIVIFGLCTTPKAKLIKEYDDPGQTEVTKDKYKSLYDIYFRKYSKQYFGIGFPWEWFKAQSIAESSLRENAISPVGARGLMQVMPGTFKDIKRKQSSILSIDDPKWNIAAGIYYDSTLYKQWSSPRPFVDRMSFMLGSYNAGLGNPLKAQKECKKAKDKGCNEWEVVAKYAPQISSWRHDETLHYVDKIMGLMNTNYVEKRDGSNSRNKGYSGERTTDVVSVADSANDDCILLCFVCKGTSEQLLRLQESARKQANSTGSMAETSNFDWISGLRDNCDQLRKGSGGE